MHWDALGCTGMHWDALGCTGMHWDALGCTGMHWDALGCAGMRWDALGCAGIYVIRRSVSQVAISAYLRDSWNELLYCRAVVRLQQGKVRVPLSTEVAAVLILQSVCCALKSPLFQGPLVPAMQNGKHQCVYVCVCVCALWAGLLLGEVKQHVQLVRRR